MKTCVSTYSFGWYRNEGQMGVLGCIDKAAEMGFNGVEFVEGDWQNDPDGPARIKERCAEKGIEPVSFCVYADFINAPDRAAEIDRVCRLADTAAAMGVKLMRHDATGGFKDRGNHSIGYDNAIPALVEGCRAVTDYAATVGVRTMTENHGFFSQDSLRVEKLINAVARDNFGALVDVGNFMCADEDPWKAVGVMAPYAFHVHVKDFFKKNGMERDPGTGWFRSRSGDFLRGAVIGHGDARVFQSLTVLKNSGYDGYVSIEFEGLEDAVYGIQLGLENLNKYLDELNG